MTAERNVLPEAWVWADLSELIQELESGSRPKGGVRGIRQGVPSVGGEHLNQSGGFDFSAVRFVPEAFAALMAKGWIQPHDILIVKDGATTGKTSFVDARFPYSKAVLNEHVFRLRAVPEVLDQRYLFRFLWGQPGQRMIAKAFRGTAQGGINQSFPQFVDVPLAPVPEQRRIVAKIDLLLEQSRSARQALDRIPPLLKKFRQSLLASAFRGDLTRDWRDQHPDIEPTSVLLERIRAERRRRYQEEARDAKAKGRRPPRKPDNIDPTTLDASGLRGLPNSWQWATIKDLSDGSRGITYGVIKLGSHYDRGIPTLRSSDVKWLHINFSSAKRIRPEIANRYRRTFLTGGEVLVSVRGTLGGVACVPRACKGFNVSREIAVVAPVPEINAEWLAYAIGSPEIQNVLTAVARGVAYTGVNIEDLKQIAIPVPSLSEQVRIVDQIGVLFAKTDAIEAGVEGARLGASKLEQSILARAFRGELVSQDPNDEPASVLLERIRAPRPAGTSAKGRRSTGQ